MKKQQHVAFAAFTPAFYRWEIQRMLPVRYPGDPTEHMEPDVGQVEDKLLEKDATVGRHVWAVYGRDLEGMAHHISDYPQIEDAVGLVLRLGASSNYILPGPTLECRGRQVLFKNDEWQSVSISVSWKIQAERMTRGVAQHLSDIINLYAGAWASILPTVEMPYKSQYLLEKLIEMMKAAV